MRGRLEGRRGRGGPSVRGRGRQDAGVYKQDLDMQRINLRATEHSEQSIVSTLQEQIVSQSEMAERRDDRHRGQIVDLTTRLALDGQKTIES